MSSTVIDGIDYGPLAGLVGKWEGGNGMDIAPDPDMPKEENPYYETITFEAAGDTTNANQQYLAALYYRQTVRRHTDKKVFHDQCGFWTWDKATGEIIHSLSIPRAMALLAGGKATVNGSATTLDVQAQLGDVDWGVVQQPFLRDNASTRAFRMTMTVDGDTLKYREITTLDIYGKTFSHSDENELRRV